MVTGYSRFQVTFQNAVAKLVLKFLITLPNTELPRTELPN